MFLNDKRIPLSNNEAERTIHHAVVGRKNYYGSGDHAGADTAATLFTVIESCKKNDFDPRTYLSMALHLVADGKCRRRHWHMLVIFIDNASYAGFTIPPSNCNGEPEVLRGRPQHDQPKACSEDYAHEWTFTAANNATVKA